MEAELRIENQLSRNGYEESKSGTVPSLTIYIPNSLESPNPLADLNAIEEFVSKNGANHQIASDFANDDAKEVDNNFHCLMNKSPGAMWDDIPVMESSFEQSGQHISNLDTFSNINDPTFEPIAEDVYKEIYHSEVLRRRSPIVDPHKVSPMLSGYDQLRYRRGKKGEIFVFKRNGFVVLDTPPMSEDEEHKEHILMTDDKKYNTKSEDEVSDEVSDDEEHFPISGNEEHFPISGNEEHFPISGNEEHFPICEDEERFPICEDEERLPICEAEERLPTSDDEEYGSISEDDEYLPISEKHIPMSVEECSPLPEKIFAMLSDFVDRNLPSLNDPATANEYLKVHEKGSTYSIDECKKYPNKFLESPQEQSRESCEDRAAALKRACHAAQIDHSYHKGNYKCGFGSGLETPSESGESEEEIDVVSCEEKYFIPPYNVRNSHMRGGRNQIKTLHPVKRLAAGGGKKGPSTTRRNSNNSRSPKQVKASRNPRQYKKRTCNNNELDHEPTHKRHLHNNMERQRRIDLRNLFTALKKLIPELFKKPRAAKVLILKCAGEYCKELTNESELLAAKKNALKKRQQQLQARVSQLRRERVATRFVN